MSVEIEAHITDLIKAGALNLEDLEINRSGYLSDKQKRWLYLNMSFWLFLVIIDLIVFVPLIYLFSSSNFIIGIVLFSFLIMLASLSTKNAKPYWKDLKDGKPRIVNGRVFKHFSMGHGIPYAKYSRIGYCTIRVGNQIFSISPSAYTAITQEKNYRVYFLPNTGKIINIESL